MKHQDSFQSAILLHSQSEEMGNKSVNRFIAASAVLMLATASIGNGQSSVAAGVRSEGRAQVRVSLDVVDAPLAGVLTTIARQAGLRPVLGDRILNSASRVTLQIKDEPADLAFAQALLGTGMWARITSDRVEIVRGSSVAPQADGSIVGKVIDAKTKLPLRDVAVSVDGAAKGSATGDDGTFRISPVPVGTHTLSVRFLGYVKATKVVTVGNGQVVSIDVALEASVNALDQVVVTGTVIPTEMKAVPNAITIITARQIEERGITKIDQLLRGDVPGMFAPATGTFSLSGNDDVVMYSRGATKFQSGGVIGSATNPMKVIVDGVELARPELILNQIDPKSIDRIEILSGPQASTIYGSNALNGVMQIFTKRGANSRPQFAATLSSGFVENNFSSSLAPIHDHALSMSGMTGAIAYNVGGSWNYEGPWTPARQVTRTSLFGSTRIQYGKLTADLSARDGSTLNRQRGYDQETVAVLSATGYFSPNSFTSGRSEVTDRTVADRTQGLTVGYRLTPYWTHEIVFGTDESNGERIGIEPSSRSPGDTMTSYENFWDAKRSIRYSTVIQIPILSVSQATATFGVDQWETRSRYQFALRQPMTGGLSDAFAMRGKPYRNTGGFFQTQLGIGEMLFLTYGLRAEWNAAYGDDAQPNLAPRYGLAFTQDVGSVTMKLRTSYGRSTRPPLDFHRLGLPAVSEDMINIYGPYDYVLANANITPELQQGWEGGLELYLGRRGSIAVTRYNQTVDDLIAQPVVDSVRSLLPDPDLSHDSIRWPDGHTYTNRSQNLNLGTIRNQGWELQGGLTIGPITSQGTYSWTKSRMLGITPKYRSALSDNPDYQPGLSFRHLPEHTWALNTSYAATRTRVMLSVHGVGELWSNNTGGPELSAARRLRMERPRMQFPLGYRINNASYANIDLSSSHHITEKIEGTLQVNNLRNSYRNDYSWNYAVIGRQTRFGVRLRW
jgi:outer membrane cobalamin receptor